MSIRGNKTDEKEMVQILIREQNELTEAVISLFNQWSPSQSEWDKFHFMYPNRAKTISAVMAKVGRM